MFVCFHTSKCVHVCLCVCVCIFDAVRTLAISGVVDGCVQVDTFRRAMRQEDYELPLLLEEMAGSGHFPHHDNPAEFNRLVTAFIAQ